TAGDVSETIGEIAVEIHGLALQGGADAQAALWALASGDDDRLDELGGKYGPAVQIAAEVLAQVWDEFALYVATHPEAAGRFVGQVIGEVALEVSTLGLNKVAKTQKVASIRTKVTVQLGESVAELDEATRIAWVRKIATVSKGERITPEYLARATDNTCLLRSVEKAIEQPLERRTCHPSDTPCFERPDAAVRVVGGRSGVKVKLSQRDPFKVHWGNTREGSSPCAGIAQCRWRMSAFALVSGV
ncbi:MAG: hypothetical protein AAGI30_03395, partial [Planctomycetota bacterium]